jgi:ankyrin repeat protein
VDSYSVGGRTPLFEVGERVDLVDLLLDFGADIKHKDYEGYNVLHYSAKFGSSKLCKKLTRAGADVSGFTMNNYSPIHIAALYSQTESLAAILQTAEDMKVSL